jgi:hypothetical protein
MGIQHMRQELNLQAVCRPIDPTKLGRQSAVISSKTVAR